MTTGKSVLSMGVDFTRPNMLQDAGNRKRTYWVVERDGMGTCVNLGGDRVRRGTRGGSSHCICIYEMLKELMGMLFERWLLVFLSHIINLVPKNILRFPSAFNLKSSQLGLVRWPQL